MNDLQLDDFKTDENAAMVLLVDDQAMIGEAVRRGLSNEENIDFHFCADPHQAIAHAVRIKPTVILQDLVMPGLDGLSLVREYRNHPATKDIPIIVLSTKEDPLIKSAAFAAGANDYLVKLPDNIELVARIRYHSRSYMTLLQRDAAYRALRVSQQQLLDTNLVLQRLMNSDGLTGLAIRTAGLARRSGQRTNRQRIVRCPVEVYDVCNGSGTALTGQVHRNGDGCRVCTDRTDQARGGECAQQNVLLEHDFSLLKPELNYTSDRVRHALLPRLL